MTSSWIGTSPPESLANVQVSDRTGAQVSLGSLWRDRPTLLLFIRHFGCIGCSEEIALLKPALDSFVEFGVGVVLVGCGPVHFMEGFIERQRLMDSGYEMYTDPSLEAHSAAMLHYGKFRSLGPRGLIEYARAYVAGHINLDDEGDPRQQAGTVYVDASGVVRFYHRNESLGDHPSVAALGEVIMHDVARMAGAHKP